MGRDHKFQQIYICNETEEDCENDYPGLIYDEEEEVYKFTDKVEVIDENMWPCARYDSDDHYQDIIEISDRKYKNVLIEYEKKYDCPGYIFMRKGICWGSNIFSVDE